jgi:CxxC-x17-CxxC domain-containing protein
MAYDENNQGQGFQRKMYQGNWKCADCGKDITELPFEPDPNRTDNLRCRDCYKPRKKSFKRY